MALYPVRRIVLPLLAALALCATGAAPAGAATTTLEAEGLALSPAHGQVFADGSASAGKGLLVWDNGSASGSFAGAASAVRVRAGGDECGGRPHLRATIDGRTVLDVDVKPWSWNDYRAPLALGDGTHRVELAFTNDFTGWGCDRNLRLDRVVVERPAPAADGLEAESLALPASSGQVYADGAADGGRALLVWSNGTAAGSFSGAVTGIGVVARGDQCDGAPRMVVEVDGRQVMARDVAATAWTTYSAPAELGSGTHSLRVSFTNDHLGSGCDRNLRLDAIKLATSGGDPFAGITWFIDPDSNAARQAAAWRARRPDDAAAIDKIAHSPQADWFGDWSGDVQRAVDERVGTITAAGALPVLVAYDIPLRDCSSYSGGGAGSPSAYRSWIRSFAAGIGDRRAVVILEPDALAGMDCLGAADRTARLALISDAVAVLSARPRVAVYVDAGHSRWHSAEVMAARLEQAGVAQARGFALNVSNYMTTSEERGYGDQLAKLLGGKHFVVDTSRNGLGPSPDGQWCNPSGRALGERPSAATGDPLADAWLWIKRPGESDGACNGGPAAGQWWADYALGLARRAAW